MQPSDLSPNSLKFSIDSLLCSRTHEESELPEKKSFEDTCRFSWDDFNKSSLTSELDTEGIKGLGLAESGREALSPPKKGHSPPEKKPASRKLGRNPRVPFSSTQVAVLEQKYQHKQYLSSIDVAELSSLLNLNDSRVKIWFQNRRARARKEQEMSKIPRTIHSTTRPQQVSSLGNLNAHLFFPALCASLETAACRAAAAAVTPSSAAAPPLTPVTSGGGGALRLQQTSTNHYFPSTVSLANPPPKPPMGGLFFSS
uniref:Msx homeobox protein n=1 Tax=Isodiametra pulchra TaxID=504439 RepID=A0A2P1DV72_ISOPU|nr:Msx homeobox protein [Isodiametra pulchra]